MGDDQLTTYLNIETPRSLRKEHGYQHTEAFFGSPDYSIHIHAQLVYANGTLCSTTDPYAPKPLASPPFLYFVDRGDCTFVTKALNAQALGAKGVVVADHTCSCDDVDAGKCTADDMYGCELNPVSMADDGNGETVSIPTVMVRKQDGDVVRVELESGSHVNVELHYNTPQLYDTVPLEIYQSSYEPPSDTTEGYYIETTADFMKKWKDVAANFGDKLAFTPRFDVVNGTDYWCYDPSSDELYCGDLCTNRGLYCAPDPDGMHDVGLSGADLVEEALRQMCVWEHYKATGGYGEVFYEYVVGINEECVDTDKFNKPGCFQTVMSKLGVDASVVSACMRDSGGIAALGGPNGKLDTQVHRISEDNIWSTPAFKAGGTVFTTAVTVVNVLDAVCSKFKPGTEPAVCGCMGVGTVTEIENCAMAGGRPEDPPASGGDSGTTGSSANGDGKKGLGAGAVVGIVFSLIAVFAVGAFAYVKQNEGRVRNEVREILAEYMPLGDGTDGNGGMEPLA